MEDKEKVIKKIENLLALAGNNPNPNEAAAAALKAQELMAKYSIVSTDIHRCSHTQKITEAEYDWKKSPHCTSKWRHILSGILAENFRCRHYTCGRCGPVIFYGYERDAAVAAEVFKFLFETGNRLAARYYQTCRKKGMNTKGVMNTYLSGFCSGIREALGRQGTALMIAVPKEVNESWSRFSKDFYEITHVLKQQNSKRIYEDGRQDGKDTAMARNLDG